MENTHNDIDATYSPEDNKLRFYSAIHLDTELYARVKKMGFIWAPKQDLFVAPKWTPQREDFCLELAGEITAEQTTLVERAEAKADRLDTLAMKRSEQANSFRAAANRISERFAYGQPILVGHHSEGKARRDKDKMTCAMDKSVAAAKAVDYWNYRAEGVEHHANRKSNSGVIIRRIGKLLAELRDRQRTINHANICLNLWEKISAEIDNEKFNDYVDNYVSAQLTTGAAAPWGFYSDLEKGKLAHKEVVTKCIENNKSITNGQYTARWVSHILNRLAYERSELGEVARFEEALSATILQAFARTHGAHKPKAKKNGELWALSSSVALPLHIAEAKELCLSGDEWRDLMQSSGYEVPAAKPRKSANRLSTVSLINPSLEEAKKLQALWNQDMIDSCSKNNYKAKIAELKETTQAIFSLNSKGDYAPFKTVELDDRGREICYKWERHERVKTGVPVCRIRIFTGGGDFYKAHCLAVLTDKPSKSLPIQWEEKAVSAA